MNLTSDDFFSPIRHVTSDSNSSDDAESLSNFPSSNKMVTFTKFAKNKSVSECNKIKCSKETNELESCSLESSFASKRHEASNVYTPDSKTNPSKSQRNSKVLASDFNKIKLERGKDLKDNVVKRDCYSKNSESLPNKREYKKNKNTSQDAAKSNSVQQNTKTGSSRPTSLLLSKKEVSESNTTKDIKKRKNVNRSSKNFYSSDMLVHTEKQLTDNILDTRSKNFEDSGKKSADSVSCKSLIYGSSNEKSDTSNTKSDIDKSVENSKSTSNMPVHSPFEISVEKIVNDLICSECEKIRQNMYAQQMSFYRELNKVKREMERQHLETTQHMFKIIEELMQVNFSLKSMP